MRSWEMTEPGDGLLAGVSGGADSVCLLFLLDELKEELGIRLAAFHLNHGLRGAEADRDEAYVKEICGRLGIPLAVAHENVAEYAAARGISGEEAGRILRYEHMKETAEQFSCQKTATAHHRDDSAETVLFNMFRGSGLKGLSGIRPVRGEVIRPLLCLSRAEIAGYLEERGIPWCEDSTNGENVYTRNRIRNQLLPWVKENINARAPEHILRLRSWQPRQTRIVRSWQKSFWRTPGTWSGCRRTREMFQRHWQCPSPQRSSTASRRWSRAIWCGPWYPGQRAVPGIFPQSMWRRCGP